MTKGLKRFGCILSLAVMFTACEFEETELEKQRKADDERIRKYLNEANIAAVRDQSGIFYEVLQENPGGEEVTINDVVSILYDIKTLEGVSLEESTNEHSPVRFLHDYQSIVPLGLDYGVQLMKKGEKFRFYIPSSMSYGSYSHSDFFDSYANFIIDIEVVDIEGEDEVFEQEKDSLAQYVSHHQMDVELLSSGIYFKTLEPGSGNRPLGYNNVTFHFSRSYLDSTLIEKTAANNPVTIPLGKGYAVPGLEEGLKKMQKGEKALLIMPSELAFKSSIQVLPTALRDELVEDNVLQMKVEPYRPVMYEVELVDIF